MRRVALGILISLFLWTTPAVDFARPEYAPPAPHFVRALNLFSDIPVDPIDVSTPHWTDGLAGIFAGHAFGEATPLEDQACNAQMCVARQKDF